MCRWRVLAADKLAGGVAEFDSLFATQKFVTDLRYNESLELSFPLQHFVCGQHRRDSVRYGPLPKAPVRPARVLPGPGHLGTAHSARKRPRLLRELCL